MPASATNHTSTDRSTCTTSADAEEIGHREQLVQPGVRDSTSSTENRPEPISAASASQPIAGASVQRVGGHGQAQWWVVASRGAGWPAGQRVGRDRPRSGRVFIAA